MEVPSNKSYVSPVLRRVFSRNHLFPSSSTLLNEKGNSRMSPRSDSRMSARSAGKNDLVIDVMTEENVQFMDQPLRGKVELSNLTSAIENVSISLKGVVKACIAGNAAWASGFGGDSNVMARYTEREVFNRPEFPILLIVIDTQTRIYSAPLYATCDSPRTRKMSYSPLRLSISQLSKSSSQYDLSTSTRLR